MRPDSFVIRPFKNVYVKIGKEMPTDKYDINNIDSIMEDLRDRIIQLKFEMEEFVKQT